MARKPSEKPPAFQLYARDWAFGTAHLTLEQQGAYVRLLAHQWMDGALPAAPVVLARLLGITPGALKRIWPGLDPHFPATADGRSRVNQRLERERAEMIAYREARSVSGSIGAEVRWGSKRDGERMANGWQNDSPAPAPATAITTASHLVADGATECITDNLPESYRAAFEGLCRAARDPLALAASIRAIAPGGIHAAGTWDEVGRTLMDVAATDGRVSPRMLRTFLKRIQDDDAHGVGHIPHGGRETQQERNLRIIRETDKELERNGIA